MINLQVLRSSSAGNCTALWHDGDGLLIDAGVSRKLLKEFTETANNPVGAVLVTHAHGDHLSNAACNHLLDNGVPFYFANPQTFKAFLRYLPALRGRGDLIRFYEERPFSVAGFSVEPFSLDHDADGGCFGYRITRDAVRVAFATDFVRPHDGLLPFFTDADAIVLESNHDPAMLEASGRPAHVKARIRERAHLSNEKSAGFLERVVAASLKPPSCVFLAHISSECNCRDLTLKLHAERMNGSGKNKKVRLCLTFRDRFSERVEF